MYCQNDRQTETVNDSLTDAQNQLPSAGVASLQHEAGFDPDAVAIPDIPAFEKWRGGRRHAAAPRCSVRLAEAPRSALGAEAVSRRSSRDDSSAASKKSRRAETRASESAPRKRAHAEAEARTSAEKAREPPQASARPPLRLEPKAPAHPPPPSCRRRKAEWDGYTPFHDMLARFAASEVPRAAVPPFKGSVAGEAAATEAPSSASEAGPSRARATRPPS